jgi:hypothetical protein
MQPSFTPESVVALDDLIQKAQQLFIDIPEAV